MSWPFARLCELAVADRVEVVVAASHGPDERRELAEVITRLALVPAAETTVLPGGHPPGAVLGPPLQLVELTGTGAVDRAPASASAVVEQLLQDATERGLALRLEGARAALRTVADARGDAPTGRAGAAALVVATDRPGTGELLREASRSGLGIAVGGVDPQAAVTMDDFFGVVSILDALATLRGFACGADPRSDQLLRRIA